MKARSAGAFLVTAGAAFVAGSLGARAFAATRLHHYQTCNFDESASVLSPTPAGLMTTHVDPKKGAIVHCPIVSDDTLSHAGPAAILTVFGHETSTSNGVTAIACVTFASSNGFYCTAPRASGGAFVGDYTIAFTGPFTSAYAGDFPFVDVTLTMDGESQTSSLRGISLSEQSKPQPPAKAP